MFPAYGGIVLDDEYRLTPTRTSRKLAALEFTKRHWAQRGASPSYSEIANALGISKKAVHRLVHDLADDGLVILTDRAERKIDLPEPAAHITIGDALVLLRREGVRVLNDGIDLGREVTIAGLPLIPELDHDPEVDDGTGHTIATKSG